MGKTKKEVTPQKVTRQYALANMVCHKCGKPLSKEVDNVSFGRKYHFECSLRINVIRAENKKRVASHAEKLVCIICEKRVNAGTLNKFGICPKCVKLVEKRNKINYDLKARVDRGEERVRTRRVGLNIGFHRTKKKPGVKTYNNPVAYRIAHDPEYAKKFPGKETAPTRVYDRVTVEGVPCTVEVRGGGFYGNH